MAWKNVGKHFILWPKQGNKIGGVVLNKVRVSNSKWLTYTQILVEFPRGSMRYRQSMSEVICESVEMAGKRLIVLICSVFINLHFWVCGWNPKVWPFKWKQLSRTFLWYCLLCCTRWFLLLCLWLKSSSVTIEVKATEQYFPAVLFIYYTKLF